MVWDRRHRWEAILQEKIAVIVTQRLNDPRLGFITITRTRLSKDKRICEVRYTVLGTDTQRRRSERALADAAPRVQELLAPTLRMRTMPELRFVYDEDVQRESRLLHLIEEVSEERRAWEALHGPLGGGEEPDGDTTVPDEAGESGHEPPRPGPPFLGDPAPGERRNPEGGGG